MTAEMIESGREASSKTEKTLGASWADAVAGGLGGALKGGANAILGNSMLSSADDLLNVLRGRQKPGNFLANAAGRFLPASSMLRFLARIGDEYERQPDGFTEYMAAATPDAAIFAPWGTRSDVPYRLDEFGRAIKNQQPGLSGLIPLRPRVSEHADDPLYQELTNRGVAFPNPPRSVDGVPITREERISFQMTAGPRAERALRTQTRDAGYRSLPPTEKAKALEKTIRDVRTQTAKEMKDRINERSQRERQQQVTGRRAA
jgi:hypothetical protein